MQVNTGGEAQKGGVAPSALDGFLDECRTGYGLDVSRAEVFRGRGPSPRIRISLSCGRARRNGLGGLSMGMSADFETAIRFGATHVRVGSAVFGARG